MNENKSRFIHENVLTYAVCKRAAILLRPHFDNETMFPWLAQDYADKKNHMQ